MIDIPVTNEIGQYLHCKLCFQELQAIVQRTGQPTSPKTYSRYSVGWTPLGLQVWCNRHEVNVAHIWFEGQQHPANLDRAESTD